MAVMQQRERPRKSGFVRMKTIQSPILSLPRIQLSRASTINDDSPTSLYFMVFPVRIIDLPCWGRGCQLKFRRRDWNIDEIAAAKLWRTGAMATLGYCCLCRHDIEFDTIGWLVMQSLIVVLIEESCKPMRFWWMAGLGLRCRLAGLARLECPHLGGLSAVCCVVLLHEQEQTTIQNSNTYFVLI